MYLCVFNNNTITLLVQSCLFPVRSWLMEIHFILQLPPECSDEFRTTTSLSQEFLERASPFYIADGDGHSSIASPVLSAVASE